MSRLLAFVFLLTFASTSVFANPTVSILPESSTTYPSNTTRGGLTSNTNDPLAPFSGNSVHFVGFQQQGGSSETRGNAWLVYRARLDFDTDVVLHSIGVAGAGDHTGDSVLRLLDENMVEIATTDLTGFNVLGTHTLDAGGVIGNLFFLDEFDRSTTWRYRSLTNINFVPEPSTLGVLAFATLILFSRGWVAGPA